MPFAAALSEHPLATHAIGEIVGDILDQLALEDGEAVDFATVFVTAPHVGVLEDVASTVRALLHPPRCSAPPRSRCSRVDTRRRRRRRCRSSQPVGDDRRRSG